MLSGCHTEAAVAAAYVYQPVLVSSACTEGIVSEFGLCFTGLRMLVYGDCTRHHRGFHTGCHNWYNRLRPKTTLPAHESSAYKLHIISK